MDAFSMSLDLVEHGWAYLSLEDAVQREKYMFSHVGVDSLSGIVDSAIRLSRGQDSEIHFNLEPQEISYRIVAQADGAFLLTVQDSSFRSSSRRYIRQVLKMFDQYALAHGEYVRQWHHAYPTEKLELLRISLHS